MTVDPTDPDTFEADGEISGSTSPEDAERDDEPREAAAAAQYAEVRRRGDQPLTHIDTDTASEGDAVEQARSVDLDEYDEYDE
ncbi:hypothetical protein [Streptomyces sp. NPDC051569]|uniref:hypothetical protein n=1 Tax=Streptomyces sp. NPDC051569 TaxID=3365661 RepID=UPI0037993B69